MDKARIERLTDAVMAAITDGARSGVVPWTVTNLGHGLYEVEDLGEATLEAIALAKCEATRAAEEHDHRDGSPSVTAGTWRERRAA